MEHNKIKETDLMIVDRRPTMEKLSAYLVKAYGYGLIRYHYTIRGSAVIIFGTMHIEYLDGNGKTIATDIGSGIRTVIS